MLSFAIQGEVTPSLGAMPSQVPGMICIRPWAPHQLRAVESSPLSAMAWAFHQRQLKSAPK